MATKPGFLTDWPWKPLGNFKYLILAPWAIHSLYYLATKSKNERDYTYLIILPFLLSRALHNQIWISMSRHRTAKGNNRILDRSIEFEQVDRESNWDDQILLLGLIMYLVTSTLSNAFFMAGWRSDGVIITMLLHSGPVEYLYYWLHRALHHHYLYSRYHSHHHSSIVTEPISSVIHPFAEMIAYMVLFSIPVLGTVLSGTASLASAIGYITYIDLMNNMGHCNFELIPKWLFSIFPPLKYLMYTPSFHSLHHTQFRTNYSLFMPFYDYIHGTTDKLSNALYEASLERKEDIPDVVHLTHLITPESIFHLQLGLASFASRPLDHFKRWPLSRLSVAIINFIGGRTFVVERNSFGKLKLQSWAIPRYRMQYFQGQDVNALIEEALLQAEERGAKVLSLGLLNQDDEVNKNGAIIIEKHPNLRIKVVDGTSLAVGIVVNSIPKGTVDVMFRGRPSKLASAIVSALCQKGIGVSKSYTHKVWIIGDGMSEEEQLKAPKGTLFIPFSHFPPKKARDDAFYCHTPSMIAPPSLHNLHSCENWLPRKVMSASRVAGIVHGLEGWNVDECGDSIFDVHKIWEASLKHGFRPTPFSK